MTAQEIWTQFEACEAVHTQMGIDSDTESAYRFYEGDQWYGLESGGEQLPVYNFIAPLVRYKTAMIAMNNMQINYSAPYSDSKAHSFCNELTKLASRTWENLEMDSKCWEAVKAAIIAGDSYAYFYGAADDCQILDRTDVFFADESCPDVNSQSYVFIRERRPVSAVIAEAEQNGADSSEIVADDDGADLGSDKCTSLLRMQLKDGDLYFTRSTAACIYQPEQVIPRLGCYPIAALVCSRHRGSARGLGEVKPVIPNQIEINRNLVRRLMNAKLTAYSRLVYSAERIANPSALTEVGTAIEVDGGAAGTIRDAVCYLSPSSMSPDAKNLSDEMLSLSKELAGAGDAVIGSIDPTEASGTAIIAVRDQAALALNEQTAAFRKFCEDIARIWYRLWLVYKPGAVQTFASQVSEPCIRVDVTSANPFSKFAREQALEKLFTMGQISLEEYVEALDDDSSVPKSRLEHIINKRGGSINADNTD